MSNFLRVAITTDYYLTLAVTLERYFAVCHPFYARRICTWRRACQCTFFIVIVSLLYNSPRWFEYTCTTVYDINDNSTVIGCAPITTELRRNEIYDIYYVHVLYMIVHYVLPILFLVIFNTLIYKKVTHYYSS
jgi:hypothetical protein